MLIIDLTKPKKLPNKLKDKLDELYPLCIQHKFFDHLVEDTRVRTLIRDLNDFCLRHRVVGIHYTRAMPESIKEKGLLLRSGAEIRSEFLKDYSDRFTESEFNQMREMWAQNFNMEQQRIRDHRVWFNFTKHALSNRGASPLLKNFGGEQIYFYLSENLKEKIRNLGKPLVVYCSLDPNQVKTFREYSWGKILLSSYHLSVNHEAHIQDTDAYQSIPVTSDEIIRIQELDDSEIF